MTNQKTGYISLVGRPNAGKSTLLNALVGQKIAGVSAKPQTTRNKILGICQHNHSQILFLDTPGMHRLKKAVTINSLMNKEAFSVIEESNVIVYLVDVTQGLHRLDQDFLTSILKQSDSPLVIALSKTDRVKKQVIADLEEDIRQWLGECSKSLKEIGIDCRVQEDILHVSAKNRQTFLPLLDYLDAFLPESPWLYPEDDLTDRPQKFIASELIREKAFRCLGEEIPYHTAVTIDEMNFTKRCVEILATIIVARNSQKGMVIGKGGSKIKEIGMEARRELEELLGQKVFLDLKVKVDSGWIDSRQLVAEYSSLDFQ